MNISERIYEIIKEKNYKQSSIAIAAGYSPKTFNNLLRGRKIITADDIAPICKALEVSPNELLLFTGDKQAV